MARQIDVLLVTGGHSFAPQPFFQMIRSLQQVDPEITLNTMRSLAGQLGPNLLTSWVGVFTFCRESWAENPILALAIAFELPCP